MIRSFTISITTFIAVIYSCKPIESNSKRGGSGGSEEQRREITNSQNPSSPGSNPSPDDSKETQQSTENLPEDGYFLGFDGKTDFSVLLPPQGRVSIKDPTIARVDTKIVQLSEATINIMVQSLPRNLPQVDPEVLRSLLRRGFPTTSIVPLKPGKTKIELVPIPIPGGTGTGGQIGSNTGTQTTRQPVTRDLVVTGYTSNDLALGKKRYETDGGGGSLRSCKSCHEIGAESDAPPHELGRIMNLNDNQTIAWLKTGEAKGRKARVEHKWGFENQAEERAIVAFLRSKQSRDVEAVIKIMVEERIFPGRGGFNP